MTKVTDISEYKKQKNKISVDIEYASDDEEEYDIVTRAWACMQCNCYDSFMITEAEGVICVQCGTTHEVLDVVFKLDK